MDVICLETEAFYALVEEVVARIREKDEIDEDKWIIGDQVMEMLGIKSRSTLQKLRDEGKIRFSQPPQKRIILYDRESVIKYIETHANETF